MEQIRTNKNKITKTEEIKNNFEKKIFNFLSTTKPTFELLEEIKNNIWTLQKIRFIVSWEEIMNALIIFKDDVLEVLYFETVNWKNQLNKTSNNIKISWVWRFSIYNFIQLAKKNWLKQIKFDIKETEIWFYEKIDEEIQLYKGIKKCEIIDKVDRSCFILTI